MAVSPLQIYFIRSKQIYCTEMHVCCIEMYVCCIYSRYIPYNSICPLVAQSYTMQDEVVNLLTLRKYTVLNGNFVFNLCDVFQEYNPGVKRDWLVISVLHCVCTVCRPSYTVNKLMHRNWLVLCWKTALYQST